METIRNVSINELHDFRNHPFKVEKNMELCELMRSIEKEGVLVPLLVRTNLDVPIKVDEELYFEGKFDTEAMLSMLEKKVLEPAGVDYSSIKIRYMAKVQEAAKNIDHVPEQDALEHEEQEQHAQVQTM